MEHIDPDKLELFAMSMLSEEDADSIERHILICRECQDSFRLTNEFIRIVRRELRQQLPRPDSTGT